MSAHSPATIRKRDGRVVSFEPERICRTLFSATLEMGRGDAVLARELTDAILHFLRIEFTDAAVPSTADLHDLIIKSVRELGHPTLARQIEAMGARAKQATALRFIGEAGQYPPELGFLQDQGLLILPDEKPGKGLAAVVARPVAGAAWHETILLTKAQTSQWLVIDGPEHDPAAGEVDAREAAARLTHDIRSGLAQAELRGLVNVNSASPPAWDRDFAGGPLFQSVRPTMDPERRAALAMALVRELQPDIPVIWHLNAEDLSKEDWLREVANLAVSSGRIEFAFDRSRYPVPLGLGLSRSHPAALSFVGLDLARLETRTPIANLARYLDRVETLARLARSVGHVQLDALRRADRPELMRGFLLDRARLVVTPRGLAEVVRKAGFHLCDDGRGAALGLAIVKRLLDALTREQPRRMDLVLDDLPGDGAADSSLTHGQRPADRIVPARQQLRAPGALHALGETGLAVVRLRRREMANPDELAALLAFAWGQTSVVRLRFDTLPE